MIAQVIPAHRPEVQLGGALVFVVLLLVVLALWRRVSRAAELERAEALIEESYRALAPDEDP